MKQLFKEKVSKFGSLISLIAITAMLAVFSLKLPEFITSTAGRVFAVVWAVTAIVAFIAHGNRMSVQRRQYHFPRFPAAKKDVRTQKAIRTQRVIRG